MSYTKIGSAVGLFAALVPSVGFSNTLLNDIQTEWARCQYQVLETDAKITCLESLVAANDKALSDAPENSEYKVWLAINLSTLAGAKGGAGALSLVKKSKVILEDVINTEPTTLNGSAYTSLGLLYYKVPGWPIAFGSDKKAEKNLKIALEIDPKGIDSNYFYADFLLENGKKKEAKYYFEIALAAPDRPGRASADLGRREEIRQKLEGLMK